METAIEVAHGVIIIIRSLDQVILSLNVCSLSLAILSIINIMIAQAACEAAIRAFPREAKALRRKPPLSKLSNPLGVIEVPRYQLPSF